MQVQQYFAGSTSSAIASQALLVQLATSDVSVQMEGFKRYVLHCCMTHAYTCNFAQHCTSARKQSETDVVPVSPSPPANVKLVMRRNPIKQRGDDNNGHNR